MIKLRLLFLILAAASRLRAGRSEGASTAVSSTVTMQVFSAYYGGGYFRPHIVYQRALGAGVSAALAGNLDLSVGDDDPWFRTGMNFDVSLGIHFWPLMKNRLEGPFVGAYVQKDIAFAYDYMTSEPHSGGLGISQRLKALGSGGWQWMTPGRYAFNLSLALPFFDDTAKKGILAFNPQLAFSVGKGW